MKKLLLGLVLLSTIAVAKVEKEPKSNPNTLYCTNVAKPSRSKGQDNVVGGNCKKGSSDTLSVEEAKRLGKQK